MSVMDVFRKSLPPTPPLLPSPTELQLRRHHGLGTCIPGVEGTLHQSNFHDKTFKVVKTTAVSEFVIVLSLNSALLYHIAAAPK
jgi:hypothetical protein